MYSKTMWNKQRYCWQLQNHVWIPQEPLKNYHIRKIWVSLHGPMTWKVMSRNVWNDIVCWRTKRLNNSTKYQLHALATIVSQKKNWNPWENCQKYALKLFWNAETWHVLEGPVFYCQWTNLHEQSDCFKTPILEETLRIQNLHRVEHCAFSEAIRLFRLVGCVRNKLQFRTVQQNQKSFPWMQDWGWTVLPALDWWDLIVAVLHGNTYQNDQERGDPSKSPTRKKIHGKIDDLDNVDFISSNVNSSREEVLLYIFEDNEAVIKMIIKEGVLQWDMFPGPTELLLIVCLTESIWTPRSKSNTFTPRTNSQTCWQREISHVMNGIIFCVQHQPFQFHL